MDAVLAVVMVIAGIVVFFALARVALATIGLILGFVYFFPTIGLVWIGIAILFAVLNQAVIVGIVIVVPVVGVFLFLLVRMAMIGELFHF